MIRELEERRVHRVLSAACRNTKSDRLLGQERRVAVRRRGLDDFAREDAGGAGAVVDDDLRAERLGQPRAEDAREPVGGAARRRRDDEADRLGRLVRGRRDARGKREQR